MRSLKSEKGQFKEKDFGRWGEILGKKRIKVTKDIYSVCKGPSRGYRDYKSESYTVFERINGSKLYLEDGRFTNNLKEIQYVKDWYKTEDIPTPPRRIYFEANPTALAYCYEEELVECAKEFGVDVQEGDYENNIARKIEVQMHNEFSDIVKKCWVKYASKKKYLSF